MHGLSLARIANMSATSGSKIPTDGLLLNIDMSSRKTYNGQRSLINMANWTVGTGGVGGFNPNQTTGTENQRIVDTDPWGNSSIVWQSNPSGDGTADGGWDCDYPSIDRTKLYRYSVWVRRISATSGGTVYLGLQGNGPTWGVAQMQDGATNGNPYFCCWGAGAFTQNQWYLLVGHCYPYGTTYTGRHPDSGYYTVSGGATKLGAITCNIGSGDVKWLSDTTSTNLRAYHYYCGDNTTHIQFYQPRIDCVDGTQPTLTDLLADPEYIGRNSASTSYNMGNVRTSDLNTYNGQPLIRIDGASRMLTIAGLTINNPYTILAVDRYNGLGANNRGRTITSSTSNWLMNHWSNSRYPYYANGWVGTNYTGESTNNWEIGIVTGIAGDYHCYYDGVDKTGAPAGGSAGPGTLLLGGNGGEFSNCDIALLMVWNRVLSASEIASVYQAIKSRFI